MKMYTVIEAAEIIGANPETVRRWVREGKFENARSTMGCHGTRISEEDIFNFRLTTRRKVFKYEEPQLPYTGVLESLYERIAENVDIELELVNILNELERG